jgi:hypothetical protein
MDSTKLKDSAASRRNSVNNITEEKKSGWVCQHCEKQFVFETGFMNHSCTQGKRAAELKSLTGQAAYLYYCNWLKLQTKSIPTIETFSTSKQYNNFIKFVDWQKRVSIPNVDLFMKLMVDSKILPVLWCREQTFAIYIEYYESVNTPDQQFLESFNKVLSLSKDLGVDKTQVYTELGVEQILSFIKKRKLSPWFLLSSTKFLPWAKTLQTNEREALVNAININLYASKIQQNPEMFEEFKQVCIEEAI